MRLVRLGRNGPGVSEMGLGCMGVSGGYGHADDAESIATIHAALEAGITMLDTGNFTARDKRLTAPNLSFHHNVKWLAGRG